MKRPPHLQPTPSTRLVKTPITPRDPTKTYHWQPPESHDALIGRVIWQWSALELMVEELVWEILNMGVESGRRITSALDFKFKIRLLKDIAPDKLAAVEVVSLGKLINRASDLYTIRNYVAHGQWVTIMPGHIPAIQTLREKLPAHATMSEVVLLDCPTTWMEEVRRHIIITGGLFSKMRNALHDSDESFR